MKRGNVSTAKKYVTHEDGTKSIQFQIQGKRNGIWIPVVERNKETSKDVPMVYDSLGEAEKQLKKIVKQIRKR